MMELVNSMYTPCVHECSICKVIGGGINSNSYQGYTNLVFIVFLVTPLKFGLDFFKSFIKAYFGHTGCSSFVGVKYLINIVLH